jgi:phage gp37-like protein
MIGLIENAILEHIRLAKPALGYDPKIASYGGELADGLKNTVRSLPAIWVVFAGANNERQYGPSVVYKARYNVIVAAQSLRNEQSGRHGQHNSAGSYQMVEDMARLLVNQKLGLNIHPIQIGAIRSIVQDKADNDLMSVYGLEITTTFTLEGGMGGDLQDFESILNTWDLPDTTSAPEAMDNLTLNPSL